MAPVENVTINGKSYVKQDVLGPWLSRKDDAVKDRKPFLLQMKVNRCFAAGKQQLDINTRDGRVVEVRKRGNVELVQANILDQYLATVQARLTSTDYKPNFLTDHTDAVSSDVTKMLNLGFTWGWQNEWHGDDKVGSIVRHTAIDGTFAIRCRYDRRRGEIVGDVPFKDGVPILDKEEAAKYVAEQASRGKTAEFKTLREGAVNWEELTMENLLPPPGYDDPKTFPWELIVRPVSVADVKQQYKELASDVVEERIENPAALTAGYGDTEQYLTGKCLVYTGYERPNAQYPKGRTVVFTETSLLDVREELPYSDLPGRYSSGVHYFRWTILPGRFWGKAFIENGIGPQKIYNKRYTQLNAIIDRNMPKVFIEEQSLSRPRTGEPMEIIEVRPGAPLPKTEQGIPPGQWMMEDLKLALDSAERALGIRGVTMGQAPQGVSAYSAMALLTENDAVKLDPVSQDFRLRMVDLAYDTMESMRYWPPSKVMQIAGPDEGELISFQFRVNDIPLRYIARQATGGSLPRSQAAEIQKINDIWNAARGALPLTWYVGSLQAGKPLDIPPSVGDSNAHKAELENIAMASSLQPAPVAPYDDDARHVEIHRAYQLQQRSMADQGDERAAHVVAVIEAHVLEHEQAATTQAASTAATPPAAPAGPSPVQGAPGGGTDLRAALGGGGLGGGGGSPALQGLGSAPAG